MADSCKDVAGVMRGVRARTRMEVRGVLPGLYPVLFFPLHIVHSMGNTFTDPSLLEMGREIRLSQWSFS